MLFNSFAFAAFGPVVYATWRLLPKAAARWWLLAASLFFYGSWDWRFLGLLVATSTLDWALALQMESTEGRARKALVTTSVVVNLSTLAIFKYLGFFAAELGHLLARFGVALPPLAIDVVLPVGISFYTFQAIGYSVDVYRRELPAVRRLPDFLLFITFFPHLVAGPIQRSAQLLPQLAQMQQPSRRQMSEGAWLIL